MLIVSKNTIRHYNDGAPVIQRNFDSVFGSGTFNFTRIVPDADVFWVNVRRAISELEALYYPIGPDPTPPFGGYVDVNDGFLVVAQATVKRTKFEDRRDPYVPFDGSGVGGGLVM